MLRASRGGGLGDLDNRPLLENAALLPGENLNEDPAEDRVALDPEEADGEEAEYDENGNFIEPEDEDALDNAAFRQSKRLGVNFGSAAFAGFGQRRDRARPRNLKYKSLYIFSGKNYIRRACHWFVTSTHYSWIMLLIVLANSLALAWYDPVQWDSPINRTITILNSVCTAIFALEALAKIIAFGLVLHEGAYLRKFWNHVDLFVLVTGVLEIIMVNGGYGNHFTRAIRAFRPIRVIRFVRPVKRLATAIMKAGPYILNVGLLLLVFYLVFGLAGVESFGDMFRFHCVDLNDPNPDAVIPDDTCSAPRLPDMPHVASWMGGRVCPVSDDQNLTCAFTNYNPSHNGTSFDTFPMAVLTIFQCVTLEGWTPVSYWAMNATGDFSVIYFILLPLLGAFFFMNLFLGAIQAVYSTIPKHIPASARRETEPLGKHPTVRQAHILFNNVADALKRPEPGSPEFESSCYLPLAYWIRSNILESRGFYWFQMISTAIFVVAMASYHDEMSPGFVTFIHVFDIIISSIFSVELLVQLFGLGLYDFMSHPPQWIDVFVVVFSWGGIAANGGGWAVLRVIRIIRLARLTGTWKRLRKLAQVVTGSAANLLWTLILMIIVLYMFTLLGMEIFGGRMDFPDGKPRYNYDTFWSALVSVFSILGVENWHQNTLYNSMRAVESKWGALFPVSILVIPNCPFPHVILNLFLSVFLDEFKEISDAERKEQQERLAESMEQSAPAEAEDAAIPIGLSASSSYSRLPAEEGIQMGQMGGRAVSTILESMGLPTQQQEQQQARKKRRYRLLGYSLRVFGPESPVRVALADFITHTWVRVFITLIIVAQCVFLAMEKSPRIVATNPAVFAELFKWADITFFIIYSIEFLIKIIVCGVVMHRGAFFRSAWHWVEFLAVVGLAVIIGLGPNCPDWLRAFLALVPLRLLSRFKRTRLILATLSRAIPAMQTVLPVALFVWTIFAVFGVQLFGSRLGACNDDDIIMKVDCVGLFNKTDEDTGLTALTNRTWVEPDNNFNDIFQALFSIFKMSTGEGWPETMNTVMDITGVHTKPRRDASAQNAAYFMAFVPLCLWFVLGLVVGTVIDAFDEIRSSAVEVDKGQDGTDDNDDDDEFLGLDRTVKVDLLLTQQQKRWVQLQQVMVATSARVSAPAPEDSPFRMFFYRLISRKAFDYAALFVVACNALMLTFNTNTPTEEMIKIQGWGDVAFTIVYSIEIIIRLIAVGLYFFKDGWNLLDLVTTILSAIGWGVGVYSSELASLIRIAKILRVLKITKLTKRQRVMFKTIVYPNPRPGRELVQRATFANFGDGLYLVYRMSTGENWDTVMHDVINQTSGWSAIYFIVFTLIVTFLMANLFVAIVLDNFSFVTSIEEGDVTLEDVQRFRDVWREFDKKNVGVIDVDDLPRFLRNLRPPLGLGLEASKADALRAAASLDVPVYNKRIKFSDLLLVLSKQAIGIEQLPQQLVQEAVKRIALRWFQRHQDPLGDANEAGEAEGQAKAVLASKIIQRAWRSYRMRFPKPSYRKSGSPGSSSSSQ